jgi:non-ribosomal peptide synthetase component F
MSPDTHRPPTPRVLEVRSNRLARALVRLGVRGQAVFVLCCAHHGTDHAVALAAIRKADARAVALAPEEWAPTSIRAAAEEQRPSMTLACAEGLEAWRASGSRGRVVADGLGVLWWRIVELRETGDPVWLGASVPVAQLSSQP